MNENVTSNNDAHLPAMRSAPETESSTPSPPPRRHSEPRIPPIPKPHNPESAAPAKTSRCTTSTTSPGKLPTPAFDQTPRPGFFRLLIVQNSETPGVQRAHWRCTHDPFFPRSLRLVMHLRRHMKRRLALAHPPIAVPLDRLLRNFHVDDDVKFPARRHLLANILPRRHPVHRRPQARPQKRIIQILTHHRVIRPTNPKDISPARDLAIGQQRHRPPSPGTSSD